MIFVLVIGLLIWLLFGILTTDVGEYRPKPHSKEWYDRMDRYD